MILNLLLGVALMASDLQALDPKGVVEKIFSHASSAEFATDANKQGEIDAMVDFPKLASLALGKEAKKLSSSEVKWFQSTLKEIITLTVYPKSSEFLTGVNISYEEPKVEGAKAWIKSSVQKKSDITEVEYELAKIDGIWRVVDVSISGLSWVDSIQEQIRNVVKKKKWKGVKDAMNKRLEDLKAKKS